MALKIEFRSYAPAVNAARKRAQGHVMRGIAEEWFALATLRTPVDTGFLRASMSHESSSARAVVGNTAEYAPAVHEDPAEDKYRVGGPKFIEAPMNENLDAWIQRIKRALGDAL